MQAKVEQIGEVRVVRLSGRLEYATIDGFCQTCERAFDHGQVLFNFDGLSFVGSTGITTFKEMLIKTAHQNKGNIHLCSMSSEFRRVFEDVIHKGMYIFETEQSALRYFHHQASLLVNEPLDTPHEDISIV